MIMTDGYCHNQKMQDLRPGDPPAGHTALDYPKLFGYTVPIDKTVAAAMGSVIALLCVAVVGLAVGWRLAVTRSRKAYKKWGEEVRCTSLLLHTLRFLEICRHRSIVLQRPRLAARRSRKATECAARFWCLMMTPLQRRLSGHLRVL